MSGCNKFHDEFKEVENHHVQAFCYTTNADRVAATGYIPCPGDPEKPFDADDVGKVAKQLNTNPSDGIVTFWVLCNHSPVTWDEITNKTIPPDTDIKVGVTASDTTAGFLDDKIVVDNGTNPTNPLEKSILNPASDEDYRIRFDETKVKHANILGSGTNTHAQIDTHISSTSNPHSVSFTQAVAADGGTNITAAEAETLTDGSNADSLHTHTDNDEKAKVTSNDTTPGYLFDKIQQGTNITIVENNDAGNETMTISATGTLTEDCPVVQARRTTNYVLTTTWTDLILDTTDVENFPSSIEHDNVNTDRILIKETGLYELSYAFATKSDSSGMGCGRIRVNDATVIPGSTISNEDGNDENIISNHVYYQLTAGDFVSLQANKSAGTQTIVRDTIFTVQKCAGAKGADGAQGPTGSGTNLTIEEGGVSVTNTPHSNLDFNGSDFNVADNGDGSCTVSLASSTPVFGSQFSQAVDDSESSTTGGWGQKLRLTTGSLPSGVYRIGWMCEHKGSGSSEMRVQLNDTTTLTQSDIDSSTPDFHSESGFYYTGTISGIQNIDLDWQAVSATAYIRRARIEIWRVS